ncbi:MAG: hypothetical protein AB7J13_10175 [Pyrinomonadaceae bacterium]
MILLLDAAPVAGGMAIFAAVAFFFVFLAVAFVAFRLLKKTIRLGFRVLVAAFIVAVAVAGSVFLFWAGTGKSPRPQPRPTRIR